MIESGEDPLFIARRLVVLAAEDIGLRFHATRGSMSIGASKGGLPPDSLVEREEAILTDCIRVIDAFHDPSEGSMCRVGLCELLVQIAPS